MRTTRCSFSCNAALSAPCSTPVRSPTLHRLSQRSRFGCSARRTGSRSGVGVLRAQTDYRYPEWDFIWGQIVDKVKTISPSEAVELVSSGKYVLVDVRKQELYDEAHAEGAKNVPLFQNLSWSDGMKFLKGVAYLVNGVAPVESNPDFVDEMKKITDTGVGIIMYCEAGGTMNPSTNFMTGKTSRSLKAAFRVLESKLAESVLHLEGGIYNYVQQELPITGEYDPKNAGKTPSIAAEPKGEFIDKK